MLKTFCYSILFLMLTEFIPAAKAQTVNFNSDFAPTAAYVSTVEKPYRDAVSLNGSWKFAPVEQTEKLKKEQLFNPQFPAKESWENTAIKIPSPWNVNSFARGDGSGGDFVTFPSYPKKWENIKAGWLMRKINYHKEWKGKRVFIHFDAIAGYSKIFINGHVAAENSDTFLPFEVELTSWLKEDQDNELLVWVAGAELFNEPGAFGRRLTVAGSFWGQHIKGIWQDVNLVIKPAINIEHTFVKTLLDQDELNLEVTISNTSAQPQQITVSADVHPWICQAGQSIIEAPEPLWKLGGKILSMIPQRVNIPAHTKQMVTLKVKAKGRLKNWSPQQPNLYGLVLTTQKGQLITDKHYTRFGWRQFSLQGNQYLLNGKPITFNADSWHFMGVPQMTRRYAWAWYKLLKDSHANAVRLHAQPYPQFYLDMADEMGICVLDETGMWASDAGPKINSEEYWKNSENHLKRLVLRDRNHPSVFGWSVCNENLPIAIDVLHAPDTLVKRQIAEINKWIGITRQLDPTRPWISGDGETQADISSPILIGHYGNSEDNYKSLSGKGKVWGIGESGMAYYATPLQSAVYNGNRSYTSQQGRMEGVAIEATQLINRLKKYHSSYSSIFNIVWYGLKPLELGLRDTTRAPVATDGIYFKPFQEGKPGMQPERLGPYTSTLNPGYDPTLPLYHPWPLFDAIQASFADTAMVVPVYKDDINQRIHSDKKLALNNIILLSADKDAVIAHILQDMGLDNFNAKPNSNTLLLLDGRYPPEGSKFLALSKSVTDQGGKIMVWGTAAESLPVVNQYLPQPVSLTTRKATSFTTEIADPLINGLGNVNFYFSELSSEPVMNHGLSGAFANQSQVILKAANPDWLRWNKRAEYLKTAALIRSERETKQGGNVLLVNGNIYYCALDPKILSRYSFSLIRQLFINFGFSFNNSANNRLNAINSDGILENALVLGALNAQEKEAAAAEILKAARDRTFYPGNKTAGHFWETAKSSMGIFDLNTSSLQGSRENAVAYASFWIYSPRSLSDLLAEPDMPRLDLLIGTTQAYQVFLNNKIVAQLTKGAAIDQPSRLPALALEKGWNHFLIRTDHSNGDWKMKLQFESNKQAFLKELQSQVSH